MAQKSPRKFLIIFGGIVVFFLLIIWFSQEMIFWNNIINQNSIVAYQRYIKKFPEGSHTTEAKYRMNILVKELATKEHEELVTKEHEVEAVLDYQVQVIQKDPDPMRRKVALQALTQIGTVNAFATLAKAIPTLRSAITRAEIVEVLRKPCSKPECARAQAEVLLLIAKYDDNIVVRRSAVRAVTEGSNPSILGDELTFLLTDTDRIIREEALQDLCGVHDSDASKILVLLIDHQKLKWQVARDLISKVPELTLHFNAPQLLGSVNDSWITAARELTTVEPKFIDVLSNEWKSRGGSLPCDLSGYTRVVVSSPSSFHAQNSYHNIDGPVWVYNIEFKELNGVGAKIDTKSLTIPQDKFSYKTDGSRLIFDSETNKTVVLNIPPNGSASYTSWLSGGGLMGKTVYIEYNGIDEKGHRVHAEVKFDLVQ